MRAEYRKSASAALLVFIAAMLLVSSSTHLSSHKFHVNLIFYVQLAVLSTIAVGYWATRSPGTWSFFPILAATILAFIIIYGLELVLSFVAGLVAAILHLKNPFP